MIRNIQAIDLHSHYNHGSPYDARDHEQVLTSLEHIRKMYITDTYSCGRPICNKNPGLSKSGAFAPVNNFVFFG